MKKCLEHNTELHLCTQESFAEPEQLQVQEAVAHSPCSPQLPLHGCRLCAANNLRLKVVSCFSHGVFQALPDSYIRFNPCFKHCLRAC